MSTTTTDAQNPGTGEGTPRWQRRPGARPEEILKAAMQTFVERGFAATKLDEVAARAGVSKGTLYLYFTNKEELFKAVVRANIVATIGEAEQDFALYDGPSGELLGTLLMRWWTDIWSTPLGGITKLMLAEGNNFPELAQFYNEEVVARGSSLIGEVLKRGIARGEFRPVDPVVTTRVLIAPVLMLMMWTHSYMPTCDMPEVTPEAFMDTFVSTTLRGLKADAA